MDFSRTAELKGQIGDERAKIADLDRQIAAPKERRAEELDKREPSDKVLDKCEQSIKELESKRQRSVDRIDGLGQRIQHAENEDARELGKALEPELGKLHRDREARVKDFAIKIDVVEESISKVVEASVALATAHEQARLLRGFGVEVELPAGGSTFDVEEAGRRLTTIAREIRVYPDEQNERTRAIREVLEARKAEGRSFVPPPPSKPKANFWREVLVDRPTDAVCTAAKAAVEAGDSHGWEMIGGKLRAIFVNEAAAEEFARLFQRNPTDGAAINAPHATIGEAFEVGA